MAIPSKGALAKPAQELAKDLGFENGVDGREYVISSSGGKRRFLLARAKDIPAYVEEGAADLGITGKDLVEEQARGVREVMQLPFGFCKLVYAVPQNSVEKPKTVATAFPKLAQKFLFSKGIDAEVVWLAGAIEASVAAGIADAVIDLASSGRTLEANGLRVVEEIMRSSAVVIANQKSLVEKKAEISEVLEILKGEITLFRGALAELSEEEKRKLVRRNEAKYGAARETAREVFDRVERERDEALVFYSEKFDGVRLKPKEFQVTPEEIREAYSLAGEKTVSALKKSAENIARFAKKELPQKWEMKLEGGFAGKRIVPFERVGVYAPGGTAAYPSSALMGIVPAKVAGVQEVILCTPCNKEGKCSPAVLVAADIAGATRIYKLGGAQAIAAMAVGTRTVPKVDKIVGPGNAFVAAAKVEAQSRGLASIDSPAGPSELLIVADSSANPSFAAAEMLAQAEHGPDAAVVLAATTQEVLDTVEREVREQLKLLPRRQIIRRALAENGALLLAQGVREAIAFSNEYAPEHLLLLIERPFAWIDEVSNAGAVFAGNYSSVAAGDYCAGPNHVLPTGGAARSCSGLSAADFVRQVNYLKLDKAGLAAMADSITTLAEGEGLNAHASAVRKRFEGGERQ